MDRVRRDREDQAVELHGEETPAPPVAAGSLQWASAVGNQAVQRLAREAMPEAELEEGAAEAEEVPPEVEAMHAAGIGEAEAAGLAAVDDLAEDDLPG